MNQILKVFSLVMVAVFFASDNAEAIELTAKKVEGAKFPFVKSVADCKLRVESVGNEIVVRLESESTGIKYVFNLPIADVPFKEGAESQSKEREFFTHLEKGMGYFYGNGRLTMTNNDWHYIPFWYKKKTTLEIETSPDFSQVTKAAAYTAIYPVTGNDRSVDQLKCEF